MATYSVDERRPRCMDSFGGVRVDMGEMSEEVHGFLWGFEGRQKKVETSKKGGTVTKKRGPRLT
ncbi:MAG: hypothetical protein RR716_07785 [Christensenellaceae bacterium]